MDPLTLTHHFIGEKMEKCLRKVLELGLVPRSSHSGSVYSLSLYHKVTTKVLSLKTLLVNILSWPLPNLLLAQTSSHALPTPVLSPKCISWLQHAANMLNTSYTPHKRHDPQGCKARKSICSNTSLAFFTSLFSPRMLSLLKKIKSI